MGYARGGGSEDDAGSLHFLDELLISKCPISCHKKRNMVLMHDGDDEEEDNADGEDRTQMQSNANSRVHVLIVAATNHLAK